MSILMLLFIIPFVTAIIAFLMPSISPLNFKRLAIVLSLLPLVILCYGQGHWIGTHVEHPWLPALSIQFYLSIDALSLVFLYLTAIVIPVSLFAVPSSSLSYPNMFYGLVFLLQGLLIGFFTARDLAVFTLFWEAMLIPLYFVIALWGSHQRQNAALKFLIYMIAGSVLMVAAVLALYFADAAATGGSGTFNMDAIAKAVPGIKAPYMLVVGAIFLLAFSVKTPLFPFHAWLPDAYCEAPVAGTILLSAILSKAGVYGFLRIGFEFFPLLMQAWAPLFLGLAIVGVFYGGLAAWTQQDFKRLIAYSSFSHINFVLVGVFIMTQEAQTGAILQALNHGIAIAALFLVAGWLEERIGSTAISRASGLTRYLPYLSWTTLFFVLAAIALPGTNNFVGELLILFGLFGHNPWLTAILGLSIILSVMYMLRWMQKMYFETPIAFQEAWIDISRKEIAMALPLIALILWIGIYPTPFLDQIKPAAEKIILTTHTEESPS